MPRFLAVYSMKPEDLAHFRSRRPRECDRRRRAKAVGGLGGKNAASFPDRGGMVGKTTRVTKDGVADAVNPFCGYVVVEADTIDAAACLFENPPAFLGLPGDGVDIMPFLTPAPAPA